MGDISLFKKLTLILGGSFIVFFVRLILRRSFSWPFVFFWITFVGIIILLDLTVGRWIRGLPAARKTLLSIGAVLILFAAVVWLFTVFLGYPLGLRSTMAVVVMIILGLLFWWARKDRSKGVPEKLR